MSDLWPDVVAERVDQGNLVYIMKLAVPEQLAKKMGCEGNNKPVVEAEIGYCPMHPDEKVMIIEPCDVNGSPFTPFQEDYKYDSPGDEYPIEQMKKDFLAEAGKMFSSATS